MRTIVIVCLFTVALAANIAFAGADVVYELDTQALVASVVDRQAGVVIELKDREWAMPGVEQRTWKSDVFVADWCCSRSACRFLEPDEPVYKGYADVFYAEPLPQWIDATIWPLTRELWGGISDPPAGTSPGFRLRGFDGMNLAMHR